jgi:hypothetical protein
MGTYIHRDYALDERRKLKKANVCAVENGVFDGLFIEAEFGLKPQNARLPPQLGHQLRHTKQF